MGFMVEMYHFGLMLRQITKHTFFFNLQLLFNLAFVSRNNDCEQAYKTYIVVTFDNPVMFL